VRSTLCWKPTALLIGATRHLGVGEGAGPCAHWGGRTAKLGLRGPSSLRWCAAHAENSPARRWGAEAGSSYGRVEGSSLG